MTTAQKKLHKLLERYSQRELAAMIGTKQPTLCHLLSGKHGKPRAVKAFARVGIQEEDWAR